MLSHAIIPAAGLATRFLPASKAIPKEMFPLYDRPVIQHIVEEASSAGIDSIVFVTAEGKDAIADHFDRMNPKFRQGKLPDDIEAELTRLETLTEVISVRQKTPKGLGHAVLCGLHAAPEGPFVVMLPDMFLFSKTAESMMNRMARLFEREKRSVIALMRVPDEDRKRYGMVEGSEKDGIVDITKLVEKPGVKGTTSNLAIVGRYIFSASLGGILAQTAPGAKGEIQLTDAMSTLNAREPMLGLVLSPDDLAFDAGDKEGYAYAGAFLATRRIPGFIDTLRRLTS